MKLAVKLIPVLLNNMNKKQINLFWPSYNGKEIQEAMKELFPEDMGNRWIGQGKVVDQFEQEFGKKFSYEYCLGVNSGSAALDLAYHLLDLKPGDEVITPVLTCTATNLPLLRRGVKLVFADVLDDLTIDPDSIKSKIRLKTKAIVAVTLGGLPIDEEVFKIGKRLGIPIVIDACQSLGISEQYGDYVCYSFQATKHFTTADGGMLVVRNKKDYDRAKKLRWFGINREAKIKADWQPYKNREMTMNINEAGYKYHMNDISARLGLIGLKDSDKYLRHRKKIADYYTKHLKCTTISGGSYWLYGVLVGDRDKIAEKLKESGIETNLAHLRNDIFTVFGGVRLDLLNMNTIEPQYLYIPINTKMSFEDAKYVVKILNKIL